MLLLSLCLTASSAITSTAFFMMTVNRSFGFFFFPVTAWIFLSHLLKVFFIDIDGGRDVYKAAPCTCTRVLDCDIRHFSPCMGFWVF